MGSVLVGLHNFVKTGKLVLRMWRVRRCVSVFRGPPRLHTQSERTHPQSESTPHTCDVIGGRLRLLSRAALPVLNKNFVLSGWCAQRSAPVCTHEHARVLTHMWKGAHGVIVHRPVTVPGPHPPSFTVTSTLRLCVSLSSYPCFSCSSSSSSYWLLPQATGVYSSPLHHPALLV